MTAYKDTCERTDAHAFGVGDKVVFTNDFGVCWGVKVIAAVALWDGKPRYYYEGTDTPWYPTHEKNLKLADEYDLLADHYGADEYFQNKHGFTPTTEQLGGCY